MNKLKASNRISDDLFVLIKSLSKSEKRYFKIFTKGHGNTEEFTYLKLFDLMDKQKTYDENELISELKKIKPEHFSAAKNFLYNLILKSLHLFHSDKSINSRILELLHHAEILHKKGLDTLVQKTIDKAKKIAKQYEKHNILLELTNMEGLMTKYDGKQREQLYEQEKNTLHELLLFNAYNKSHNKATMLFESSGERPRKSELETYRTILSDILSSDKTKLNTMEAKYQYHAAHSLFFQVKEDYLIDYFYRKDLVKLLESNPELLTLPEWSLRYEVALNRLFQWYTLEQYEEKEQVFEKLRKHLTKSGNENFNRRMLLHYPNLLFLHIESRRFQEGAGRIKEIETALSGRENTMPDSYKITLYYYIFYTYFGSGKTTEALNWLNKLLNETPLHIREDIHSVAKIANLLIHYDLKHYDLLEYLIKSTYRFLSSRNRLYKFETVWLMFLRKILMNAISAKEITTAFEELKNEITEVLHDPFERKVLEYFDFISWLRSKTENRPFSEIVSEK